MKNRKIYVRYDSRDYYRLDLKDCEIFDLIVEYCEEDEIMRVTIDEVISIEKNEYGDFIYPDYSESMGKSHTDIYPPTNYLGTFRIDKNKWKKDETIINLCLACLASIDRNLIYAEKMSDK